MSDQLQWYEGYPPRDVDFEKVTALLRVLAARPRIGLLRKTPVVALELWIQGGTIRWLVGMSEHLTPSLPSQLRAHLPGLTLVGRKFSQELRPATTVAADVRVRGLSFPLRLDTAEAIVSGLASAARGIGAQEWAVIQWVVGPAHPRREAPRKFDARAALGLSKQTAPDATEQRAWRDKIAEPVFAVRGRIGAGGSNMSDERAGRIIRSLFAAFTLANAPYAELAIGSATAAKADELGGVYKNGASWSSIINAAELAALVPLGAVVTANKALVLHPALKQLRLPLDELHNHTGERIIGVGLHPADQGNAIRIPIATCNQHVALVGPNGSGKSTLLSQWALSDINAGRSLFLVENRGDLIEDILGRMPDTRHDELVVIDPASEWAVGINPLAGPRDEAERRADEVFSAFRAEFGTGLGPRSSHILLNALMTIARLEDGTLTDVMLLLKNTSFRRSVLAKVNDPLVLGPFWAEYNALGPEQQQAQCAPLSNKLSPFISRPAIRRMLGQPHPSFSFADLFAEDKRRIVLVNLNEGLLGPETARLLGGIVLSHWWLELQRRAAIPREKRHMVMCIIDEWQSFVRGLDFGLVLAQARGFGVSVTTANQHTGQLDDKLKEALAANARSRFAWRPSHRDRADLVQLFGGGVTPDDLEQLKAYEVCARLIVENSMTLPFTVKTLPLPPARADAQVLRRASQQRYGVPGEEVDRHLIERSQGSEPPDAPIGTRRRRVS